MIMFQDDEESTGDDTGTDEGAAVEGEGEGDNA